METKEKYKNNCPQMKNSFDNLTKSTSTPTISPTSPQKSYQANDSLSTIKEALSEFNSDAGTELSEMTTDSSPTKPTRQYQSFYENSYIEKIRLCPISKFSQNSSKSKTESLSPSTRMGSKFSVDFSQQKQLSLPVSGTSAMTFFPELLTETECKEIINYSDVYYIGDIQSKNIGKVDDEEGWYIGNPGDHLAFRYEILETLGRGSFGKVFKCLDHKRNIYVAVKVLHKSPRMKLLADKEIKALEKINESDPEDAKCLIKMLQCFEYRRHICITFELMSLNLYHFIRNNKFRGLENTLVKRISVQILIALRHIHSLGIIHRDLKLENILLKHENKSSVKLIDFGSSTMHPNQFYSYVQSRYYRAPEVLFGCGYDNKIDIWSFGCIVVELASGKSLFPGLDLKDQVHKIVNVLGMPPNALIDRGRKKKLFFDKTGALLESKKGANAKKKKLSDFVDENDEIFKDFVLKCLDWNPESRISAEEALKHPWIKNQSRSNFVPTTCRKNTA